MPTARLLVLGLLATLAGAARAQEYAFRSYGAESGLPVAYAVASDGAGSLLVGTNDGLARFDGRSFEPVPLPVEGVVWRLTAAPDGAVWGLTTDGELFHLGPDGAVSRVPAPAPLRSRLHEQVWPVKLRADGRGRLWLSGGETAAPGQAPALYRWEPGPRVWTRRHVPGAGRINDFFVRGDGDDGSLVVAARGRVGRLSLQGGRLGAARWTSVPAGPHAVRPHPTELAWVAATEGVFLIGRDGRARRVTGPGDGVTWVHGEPAVDAAGRLLVAVERAGGGQRMERLGPDGAVELSAGAASGLLVLPNQFAFDPEGALWIAHVAGLTTLEEERAVAFPIDDARDASYVTDLAGDPARGVLWAGTYGGRVYRLGHGRLDGVSGPEPWTPRSLVVGADGEADWAESDATGAVWRRGSSRTARPAGLPLLVHDGPAGRFETSASGLWRVRGGRRTRLATAFLPGAAGAEDAAGRLWLHEDQGRLDVVWGDTLASACPACLPRSLRSTLDAVNGRFSVVTVAADRWGRVWVGGDTGGLAVVYRRPGGAWTHRLFGLEDGLLARKVDDLALSPDGRRLWLATWRGIQGLRLGPGPPRIDPFAELRARDGLEGERALAVLEASDGRLWAALVLGKVHRLDWRALTARRRSPAVHVERVEVNGRAVAARASLSLREGDGLVIGLWPQTYRQALRVRIEYRLALPSGGGRDTAWTDLGPARRIVLAALPAGRYAVEARAVRPGQPPGRPVRLGLAVAPPFWETGWFAALAALALGLVATAGHRVREGRRRAAEALRFRIATDLHDEMGGGLSQVALYTELIRRTAEGTAGASGGTGDGALGGDRDRVAAWAASAGEQARTLSGSMRDVVWAIRPDEGAWDDLELRMKDAAVALLAPRDVALDWDGTAEGAPPVLSPAVRQNVLLFFKEAVHNAARHAGAGRVEVQWRLSRRALRLRVSDDGRGFDPAAVRPGTGLVSMRRRAADLGGTLAVESVPGQGTRLTLDVPVGSWRPSRRTFGTDG